MVEVACGMSLMMGDSLNDVGKVGRAKKGKARKGSFLALLFYLL